MPTARARALLAPCLTPTRPAEKSGGDGASVSFKPGLYAIALPGEAQPEAGDDYDEDEEDEDEEGGDEAEEAAAGKDEL